MLRKFIRRHRLTTIVFILLLVALVIVPWGSFALMNKEDRLPPTSVITESAFVIDQGVEISWLASHAGIHPIAGYIIEAARDSDDFQVIDRVERTSTSYIDPSGLAGDQYRVRAVDDKGLESDPSESITARLPKPGEKIITGTPLPDVPDGSFTELTERLRMAFHEIDTAVTAKDTSILLSTLSNVQAIQQVLLEKAGEATFLERKQAANLCQEADDTIHASLAVIPESSHIEVTVVEAGCLALERKAK